MVKHPLLRLILPIVAVLGIVFLMKCALDKGIDGIALSAAIAALAALGGAGAVLAGKSINVSLTKKKKNSGGG